MSLKRQVLLLTCLLSALAVGGAQATTPAGPMENLCVLNGNGGCNDNICGGTGGLCGRISNSGGCICFYVQ